MQIVHGRGLGTRLVIGFTLIAVACTSSCCIGGFGVNGYPALLGASVDPNIVVWPADPGGTKFHSISSPATESVTEQDRTVSFEWPSDLALSLPGSIGSVSVLLDPSPSVELRARVRELLAEIERVNPQVITSVTVCVQSVGEIGDGKQFIAAMQRLSGAALALRQHYSNPPLVQFDWQSQFSTSMPSRMVWPNAAVPGEYFLAFGEFESFYKPLLDDSPLEVRRVSPQAVLEHLTDNEVVVFVEPMDTPSEVMQAMRELMQQATPQPKPGSYATACWVSWPLRYSEFTDTANVRLALQGRLADCSRPCCAAGAQP